MLSSLPRHLLQINGYLREILELSRYVARNTEERREFGLEKAYDKLRKLLGSPTTELGLPGKVDRALANAGINAIGVLSTKTESELLQCRGIDKKSLEQIRDRLGALGLTLGMTFNSEIYRGN